MKYIFLGTFLLLVVASLGTYWSQPDLKSSKPVLYWVTDANPARKLQIDLFHQWLARHRDQGYPDFELRVDSANRDGPKRIIQGVSGVGGDIMDLNASELPYMQNIGLFEDVTAEAKRLGFSPDKTYPATGEMLWYKEKQYAFPCNVTLACFFVNVETFKKYGIAEPPEEWTFDQFEKTGTEFVTKANPPGELRKVFFVDMIEPLILLRSVGLDPFNETMTRYQLDDPRGAEVYTRLNHWRNDLHLLPTRDDIASFSSSSGYGGQGPQLFYHGNYGLMWSFGRYFLIQFRLFDEERRARGEQPMEMSTALPPCQEFTNTTTGARVAGVYRGSQHKDLAVYFLAFLASEDYNMQIVRDADGLPPNPEFTRGDEYNKPADFPTEWKIHEPENRLHEKYSISESFSPFLLKKTQTDRETTYAEFIEGGSKTPAEATKELTIRLNDELLRNLDENPKLKPEYERLCAQQKEIESLRAAGRKVPLKLITNPFYRRYYVSKGWAE